MSGILKAKEERTAMLPVKSFCTTAKAGLPKRSMEPS